MKNHKIVALWRSALSTVQGELASACATANNSTTAELNKQLLKGIEGGDPEYL